jgi:hypothetical protein
LVPIGGADASQRRLSGLPRPGRTSGERLPGASAHLTRHLLPAGPAPSRSPLACATAQLPRQSAVKHAEKPLALPLRSPGNISAALQGSDDASSPCDVDESPSCVTKVRVAVTVRNSGWQKHLEHQGSRTLLASPGRHSSHIPRALLFFSLNVTLKVCVGSPQPRSAAGVCSQASSDGRESACCTSH